MFILASASPRRRALLRQIGAKFVSITPAVDEVKDEERPRDAVVYNALIKARKVAAEYPGHAVLGADTAVVVNGQSFGKPRDAAEARRMLSAIEGRQHTVLTGIAWVTDGCEYTDAAETTVRADGKGGRIRDPRACGDLHRGAARVVLERRRAAAPRGRSTCTQGGRCDGGCG